MRTLVAFFFIGLAIASVLPARGSELWPHDIRRIKERGRIIVAQHGGVEPAFFFYDEAGVFPDYASFPYEGKRLVGCDILLATRIAEQLGVRLQLDRSFSDYESVCRSVASGKADIGISMLSITLKRAQYLRFSTPYAVVRTGVLVDRLYVSRSRGTHDALTVCNTQGTRIGVERGCSYVDFAKRVFPNAHLVYYKDFGHMLQGLLSGETNALYDDEFAIMSWLAKNPELAVRFRFVVVPSQKDHVAVAVPPDSPNLLAFIDILLTQEQTRSEIAQLLHLVAPTSKAVETKTSP